MDKDPFKRKRMALGLAQKEFAEILEIKPNTVSRYERGVSNIPKVVEIALDALEKRDSERATAKEVSAKGSARRFYLSHVWRL